MLFRPMVSSSLFVSNSSFVKQHELSSSLVMEKRSIYEWESKASPAQWGKMKAPNFGNEEFVVRRAKPAELILEICSKVEREPPLTKESTKNFNLPSQVEKIAESTNNRMEKQAELGIPSNKEQEQILQKDANAEMKNYSGVSEEPNHKQKSASSGTKSTECEDSQSLVNNNRTNESHDIVVEKISEGIDVLTKHGLVNTEPVVNFVPAPAVLSDGNGYFADQPDQISEIFCNSVQEHTVGNRNLRKYISSVPLSDLPMMYAAISGADAGGLQLDALTYEVIISKLCAADKFQAAIQTYHEMIKHKLLPTSQTYGKLMEISLKREIPSLCHTLFRDMLLYGAKPNALNYQQLILSMAHEFPSRWEEAIAIFDKISRQRSPPLNAQTYNALMMVYMNMRPFDWRIVYNCYYEMRIRENPRIKLEWESYLILEEAMRRGRAGWLRRFFALVDAWVNCNAVFTWNYMKGVLLVATVIFVLKCICAAFVAWLFIFVSTPMNN